MRQHSPMDLAQMALIDVLFGSEIEKIGEKWIYRQGNRVRAVLGVSQGDPHGPFQVFYPTGQVWIEGRYDRGKSVQARGKKAN